MTDWFSELCHGLGVSPDRNGEVWIKCPNCGKDNRHCSFSKLGCNCFACSYNPSLHALFELLVGSEPINATPPPDKPKTIREWQKSPGKVVNQFCESSDVAKLWRLYKPVSLENIKNYRLGTGSFPGGLGYKDAGEVLKCEHRRLIVPLISGGKVLGFRCRSIGCQHKTWLTPANSKLVLYNGARLLPNCTPELCQSNFLGMAGDDRVVAGRTVAIVENPIDSLLIEQDTEILSVGTLGVSIWKKEWTKLLVAAKPKRVIVAYDNDASGNATDPEILARWTRFHPGQLPPRRGLLLTKELKKAGLPVEMLDWKDSQEGADIGMILKMSPLVMEKRLRETVVRFMAFEV